jgi:prepilin-type N-terminal cleavage/methylation domain-containing protein
MIRSYQKGFTLIEVIVIIIIVGLLGAIAIPKYISLTEAAERGNVESVIGSLRSALSLYSAKQIVSMQPITAHNPFDDLSVKPPNYVGAFGDVDLSNCQSGQWAYQSGNSSNGNWPVVVYRPKATLTQAFSWSNTQWIVLVVNEIKNANGTTIWLSLDDYPPAHQW